MKRPPQISAAEWQIMEVLWRRAPLSANEVIRELEGRTDWKPNTIRTLLARLVKKGALEATEAGNRFLYKARYTRKQHVHDESDSFLGRVFAGGVKGLLVHFAESGKLSRKDLDELKALIKDQGRDE